MKNQRSIVIAIGAVVALIVLLSSLSRCIRPSRLWCSSSASRLRSLPSRGCT